jgi:Fe-S-cluster containining protein
MSASRSDAALFTELREIYARVDAAYADWSCPGSTECCRFGLTGRQPYVTSIELALIQHTLAPRGGALAPRRRALPLTTDRERERICPLLDRSQRCSVYSDRPLGCRTFYCERATRGAGPEGDDLRDEVSAVRELAERHRLGGELARPLTRALEGG